MAAPSPFKLTSILLFFHKLFVALTLFQALMEQEATGMAVKEQTTKRSLPTRVLHNQPFVVESRGDLRNGTGERFVAKRSVWQPPPPYLKRLTDSQRHFILSFHIAKRSEVEPPAANMKMLTWDTELEAVAMERASQCRSFSSKDKDVNVDYALDDQGHSALEHWWNGGLDFDILSRTCKNPPRDKESWGCELYTKMIWAETDKIGCGVHQCDLQYSIICKYSPPPNVAGEVPYFIGERCSLCNASTPFCFKKQCISKDQCTELRAADCSCTLKCQNCGVLNEEKCVCECNEGWDGTDCSIPCRDEHPFCNIHPGYRDFNSCDLVGEKVRTKYCRRMCHECKTLTLTGIKCCDGILCPVGEVLDLSQCSCIPLCPGPLCLGRAARLSSAPWIVLSLTIVIRILS